MRAALMLSAYNAVSEAAWLGLRALNRMRLLGGRWRLNQRTGNYDITHGVPGEKEVPGPRIWMHAASVGEARAAGALARSLSEFLPGSRVLLSVLTASGADSAREKNPEIDAIVQAPVDLRGPVKRAFSWFQPSLLLLVETEIWPNMILESAHRRVPVAVVSAKMSRSSYQRYGLVRPLMSRLLSAVTCVCAQTEADGERYCGLGLARNRMRVTGDVKLDAEIPGNPPPVPDWLPAILGEGHRWLFCAGSTRPGEEEVLGRAVLAAAAELGEGLSVVMAPRHIERATSVFSLLRRLGLNAAMKTTFASQGWAGGAGPRVLVLDTMGELGGVYAGCDVAFVGGTIAPHGGHNLGEPAAAGVPVFFGPHVEKVAAVAQSLVEGGGGLMISTAEELGRRLAGLLSNEKERGDRGAAARRTVQSLQGATARTLEFLRGSGALPAPR